MFFHFLTICIFVSFLYNAYFKKYSFIWFWNGVDWLENMDTNDLISYFIIIFDTQNWVHEFSIGNSRWTWFFCNFFAHIFSGDQLYLNSITVCGSSYRITKKFHKSWFEIFQYQHFQSLFVTVYQWHFLVFKYWTKPLSYWYRFTVERFCTNGFYV